MWGEHRVLSEQLVAALGSPDDFPQEEELAPAEYWEEGHSRKKGQHVQRTGGRTFRELEVARAGGKVGG